LDLIFLYPNDLWWDPDFDNHGCIAHWQENDAKELQ
jgi:hypothetical protein